MSFRTVTYPDLIADEETLDEVLTRPSQALVEFVRSLRGPLLVLGAGGKMGPTLCVLARRAAEEAGRDLDVIAVSRFTDAASRAWLEQKGVRTESCDLLDRRAVEGLPDAENVIYLVGLKFGTQQNPARTWAVNTLVPAYVCERYKDARIAALSTGNVYPLTPVSRGGSVESDPLTPLGEYANAAVARERIFDYFSQEEGPQVAMIRLNYAADLRYGVLVDIARTVAAGKPVDVTMGYLNCIWQGDANDMVIRSLGLASNPYAPLNLTGTERLSVRELASQFGELLGRDVLFTGQEADTALLSNVSRMVESLGPPRTPLETVLRWTAHWVREGGPMLGKPTKFQVRDGSY